MSDDGRHTGDLGGNVLREEYTPFVVQERIGPLIPVKWGQGAPYNVCCPLVHGQSPVAGCGAIAAAQVMVSNYWNYGYAPKSIGKTAIDWTLIRRTILSPKLVSSGINGMPSPEGYAVAMLIAAVGIDIDTEYGLEESMAYAYDLQGFLIRMPSKNVTYETYKNSCVRNMLHDQQKATIMRGVHIENGEKKAHFWNLDGWLYRTRYIKTYYRNGTVSQRGPFCTAPQKLDTFGVFFMKYNYEIRLKAVKLVLEGGLSVREAGCHLGCGRSQVHLWVTLFERHGLAGLKLRHGSYSAEFKLSVLKHMHQNHLSLLETAVHFGIPGPFVIRQWERLYQNQGAEGLRRKPQRRRPAMSKSKTKKVKLKTTPHEELLKELEYLRAENAYLKKLQALVEERIVRESGKEPKPSKD